MTQHDKTALLALRLRGYTMKAVDYGGQADVWLLKDTENWVLSIHDSPSEALMSLDLVEQVRAR